MSSRNWQEGVAEEKEQEKQAPETEVDKMKAVEEQKHLEVYLSQE